tara:strand:- start:238 stop:1257 length:1020 start_codon:yes stop_codon:yes gene_type:complete
MSQDLLNTYVIGFDRAIRETVEVKGGKLRPYVQLATGDLYRKEGVYQRTSGGGLPQKVTNRFGDSPVSELDYSRRRTSRIAYQDGQFMDWADLSKMGTDPRNAKLTAMKNKFLRQEDITLDQALLGSANDTDIETSSSTVTLSNNVSSIYDGATAVTKDFTYEGFLSVLSQFGNNNVDIENTAPVFKISWNQWKAMMDDDNFINFDYTAQRPIDGSVGIYDYMGAKFCISNIVPYFGAATCSVGNGTTVGDLKIADSDLDVANGTWKAVEVSDEKYRACYAFAPTAALFEINPDMTTKVSERADKGFNYYAYMKAEFGAVRMEEEKVVVIPVKEGGDSD